MAVVSLELNELNFHFIKAYISEGKLPTFRRLLDNHVLFETVAEQAYPFLEPWIQWPTVHTGKTYAEHRIFRLGDTVYRPQDQIWEKLEREGFKVGAVSPMNAANACAHPDFFLPDPWTNTAITADPRIEKLFSLVRSVVQDNASSSPSTFDLGRKILPLALPYLQGRSLARYFRILPMALRYKWAKAAFLDSLLTDLFIGLMRQHETEFGSLFLNAAAHIQHHHMFESRVYEGERRNPGWYSKSVEDNVDPLLFIYEVYDRIVSQFLAVPNVHLLVTTGLSQVPNERMHYQYRIVDFEGFFKTIGLDNVQIEPRMSRDFLLVFNSVETAQAAIKQLDTVQCEDKPLFAIEDRGKTLFCQVGYFGPPEGLERITIGGRDDNQRDRFTLVSIENGIHQTIGYHLDSKVTAGDGPPRIPLTEVHERMLAAVRAASQRSPRSVPNWAEVTARQSAGEVQESGGHSAL